MSEELARYFVEEAGERLGSAEGALRRGRHGTVIFYSQECVEYSVKAIMESLSIKYPPIHDVGGLVLRLKKDKRLPQWLRDSSTRVSEIVSRLADLRIPARYGDQTRKLPPSKLFTRKDAEEALADARFVHGLSERFIEWWFRGEQ